MSPRTRKIAVALAAAAILVVLVLNIIWPDTASADGEATWMWVGGLMAFPVAAALVLAYRPENRVGWALGLVAVSAGLIFLLTWYANTFRDAPLSTHVEAVERIPAVGQFVGIVALLYVFPTGRAATALFERVFYVFLAVMATVALLWLLSPSPQVVTGRENPLGVLPGWLGAIGDSGVVLLLPFAILGIVSLCVRWRVGGSIERSQLKWFLSASIFCLAILVLANVAGEGSLEDSEQEKLLAGLLVITAFWSLPAAIVIAVLRYNLLEIDRLLDRTLTYALLTALLGAVYAGLVVGLQALLRPMTGGDDLAIVVTTLVVAALFVPARRRLQDVVNRRFNRRSYDAVRTVDAFSTRLRDQIDLRTLQTEFLSVVDSTVQPERASLWLAAGGRRNDLGTIER